MTLKYSFLVSIVFCYIITQIAAQDCIPGPITNLKATINHMLTWDTPASENCEISYYIVYIDSVDGSNVAWTYNVTGTTQLDISFLTPCYGYTFRVAQVSTNDIIGDGWPLYMTTAPPPDANVGLVYLQASRVEKDIRLEWSLEEQWIPCANRYRIVVYNEDIGTVVDYYTGFTSQIIYNLVPCTSYTFGLRAIFSLEEEGPVSTVRTTAPEDYTLAPELQSYTLTATSARITLLLQEQQFNECPITSLRVASIAPATSTTTYPITNQANRSPFTITVGGLQPDTMYVFNITANNTVGWSESLVIGVQTLAAP